MSNWVDQYNNEISSFGKSIKAELKANVSKEGLVDTGSLKRSVGVRMKKTKAGRIYRLTVRAERHGFILAHTGRSFNMEKVNGIPVEITNGKGGSDWVYGTMKRKELELAEKVAELWTDEIVSEITSRGNKIDD